ncbi:MAG: flagellar protein [Lachnospiraceae bacterium]|nr:flagellar protein [Lachnospiraceae bacterium]MBQ4068819.1 flagellar protein [Lachnospiraceae bacterium]
MEVKNCRECGRLFNYIGGPKLCPACRDELEKKFNQVKEYIQEHRTAQMQQISDDNEVSVQQIKQWVREERLTFTEDSMIGVECEGCGRTIKTGRFCDGCKSEMARGFNNLYKKNEPQQRAKDPRERAKMRFLDN